MLKHDEAKLAGFIVVTTDKGLCGGLNTNVLRVVTTKLKELEAQGVKAETVAIGNKGFGFLNRIGAKIVSHAIQLGDKPHLDKLVGPVKVLLDAYAEGRLERGVPLLHALHQHHEAGAGGAAAAAAVEREHDRRQRGRGPLRAAGTTSTSPTRRP